MNVTDSFFLCLNNAGGEVPKRIQLLPAGKSLTGFDGRSWTNNNPQKLAEISNKGIPFMPVDENHATDLAASAGGSSPAFGWFKNLSAESDGSIWADVEWTAKGQQSVANQEYRYISPVFLSSDKKEITQILRAALTNRPNLANPAINSEMPEEPAKEFDLNNKELCAALELPETASEAEILAAVKAFNTAKPQLNTDKTAQVDLAAYAPRADLNAMEGRAVAAEKQLAELNASLLKKEAEAAVDAAIAARKFPPASKVEYLNLCSTREGLEGFKRIAASMPEIFPAGSVAPEGSAGSGGKVELNAEDRAFCTASGLTEDQFKKMKEAGK